MCAHFLHTNTNAQVNKVHLNMYTNCTYKRSCKHTVPAAAPWCCLVALHCSNRLHSSPLLSPTDNHWLSMDNISKGNTYKESERHRERECERDGEGRVRRKEEDDEKVGREKGTKEDIGRFEEGWEEMKRRGERSASGCFQA